MNSPMAIPAGAWKLSITGGTNKYYYHNFEIEIVELLTGGKRANLFNYNIRDIVYTGDKILGTDPYGLEDQDSCWIEARKIIDHHLTVSNWKKADLDKPFVFWYMSYRITICWERIGQHFSYEIDDGEHEENIRVASTGSGFKNLMKAYEVAMVDIRTCFNIDKQLETAREDFRKENAIEYYIMAIQALERVPRNSYDPVINMIDRVDAKAFFSWVVEELSGVRRNA